MAARQPQNAQLSDGEKKKKEDTSEKMKDNEIDIFRDTPVRYMGYANEVGEAFRSQVHVNAVRFSYLVASGYVCADAYSKGQVAAKKNWPGESTRRTKVGHAIVDTLIWQGLASVAIPGFTINRICYFTNMLLKKNSSLPVPVRRWTTTAIGLASIPFIIKPIDRSVDLLMESTLRKWYHIDPIEESLVHHTRQD